MSRKNRRFPQDAETLTKEGALIEMAAQKADEQHDGHLTIMKFTTNWKAFFGTLPVSYEVHDALSDMPGFDSPQEAVEHLLETGLHAFTHLKEKP